MENLFPYQVEGSKWLSGKKLALLADEMGLGKTVQAIRASEDIGAKTILVVCPAVAKFNWRKEFNQWSVIEKDFFIPSSTADFPTSDLQSVICSFEYAAKNQRILNHPWDLIVIDESHYLKSIDSKRAKAIIGKDGLIHKTKHFWALSGTPAPNAHAGELWLLLYLFGATKLKYSDFVTDFCTGTNSAYGFRISGNKTEKIPELRSMLSKIMLRRRKDEVMKDLPPIYFTDVVVEPGEVDFEVNPTLFKYIFPTDTRSAFYDQVEKETKAVESVFSVSGFGKDGMKILEGMAKSVSTLRRYCGIQKVEKTAEMIKGELEIGLYEKVVIFAHHQDVIEGMRERLKEFGAVTVYGGSDPSKRDKNIAKFQDEKSSCKVFIANIQAAGTNLTLTAAHNVVFVEQDWVPGNNAQAAMRCHRIGQTKPVHVRFVGLANSIDEKVAQVLKRKSKDLTEIFDNPVLRI